MTVADLRQWFVRRIYANQNDSPAVKRTLDELLRGMPDAGTGLNVGAGDTRLDSRLVNIDLFAGPDVRVLANGVRLPFRGASFDLVVSQEAVEHMNDPFAAVEEMGRVLRSGGRLYLQVPFIIGYHPNPTNF